MPDFSKRTLLPEKMDQPGVAHDETRQALRELELVNRLLGGYSVILDALNKIKLNNRPFTIMDLGCGGGDMLRTIAKWAKKKDRHVNLIGIDWNPVMTEYASVHSINYSNITYKTMNVFDDALLKENVDITMNTLFCHHFDDNELKKLIIRMNQIASKAVIINDLHRHWFAYYSIKAITSAFSKTYLVKYDAPLSVARSLRKNEWEQILSSASITDFKLKWMWAWRWQIIINKEP
jgi:2-polyprenyl-3-methyl-5-hydroxy-6-metoxy-1,4-benzoquinol methylase